MQSMQITAGVYCCSFSDFREVVMLSLFQQQQNQKCHAMCGPKTHSWPDLVVDSMRDLWCNSSHSAQDWKPSQEPIPEQSERSQGWALLGAPFQSTQEGCKCSVPGFHLPSFPLVFHFQFE